MSEKNRNFIEKLRALPEHHKVLIIALVVTVSGLILGFFWVESAAKSISAIGGSFKTIDLPKIDLPNVQLDSPNPSALASPSVSPEVSIAGWKTYASNQGKFSLSYPPDWQVDVNSASTDPITSVIFSGDQGVFQVDYGQGFGGVCQSGYEKLEIGGQQFDVCHYIRDDDTEHWDVSGKFRDNLGLGLFVAANPPHLANRDVILKILSTFKFTN